MNKKQKLIPGRIVFTEEVVRQGRQSDQGEERNSRNSIHIVSTWVSHIFGTI